MSFSIFICECDEVPLAVLLTAGDDVGEGILLTMKLYRKVTHFYIYFCSIKEETERKRILVSAMEGWGKERKTERKTETL